MTANVVSVPEQIADLKLILRQLAPALNRLTDGFAELRHALHGGLEGFLELAAEQEAAGARVAHLEQRRLQLQQQIELALRIRGLGAILDWDLANGADEPQLIEIIGEVRQQLLRLREEESRTALLLKGVIDITQRVRMHLLSQIGADPSYSPAMIRPGAPAESPIPVEAAGHP